MSHYDCKHCGKYLDCTCGKPVKVDSTLIHKELQELLSENPWSDELPEQFDVVKGGRWTDVGKSESKVDIVQHLPSGKFFECDFSRSGDHWQGYETEFYDAVEVEPYSEVVILYRKVAL